MPAKKKTTARKATKKPSKSFEETLWDTANKLRGSVESSEYKHVVLSLIFLKFVSDKFEERRAELVALEDDGIPFEAKMTELSQTLYAQMDEAKALDQTITENLKSLGYGRK